MEQFANNPTTTLASAVTTTNGTTITVSSSAAFPSTGTFRIIIDGEIMKVTAVSGVTWTVVRGGGGSTATTHAAGAAIYGILTADALNSLVCVQQAGTEVSNRRVLNFVGASVSDDATNGRAIITAAGATYGPGASKPAAGQAGRLYIPSDGVIWSLDTGSAWVGMDQYGAPFTLPPTLSNWTQMVRTGITASITDIPGGGITVQAQWNGTNSLVTGIVRPITNANYTAIAKVAILGIGASNIYGGCGIFLAEGTGQTSKLRDYGIYGATTQGSQWNLGIGSNASSNFGIVSGYFAASDLWMKLTNDGTHRNLYFSLDGLTWNLVFQEASATGVNETYIGFFIDSTIGQTLSGGAMAGNLLSWSGTGV